mgnify:FL=1
MGDQIKDLLSSIPTSPGIYFFKNKKDQIIYIGKAKSLRNRVRSYFTSINKKDAKTQVLVRHIADIDYLIVRSETEALLTEANLIKQHRPRYNVFLKDDKTFPYIRITAEDYPQIEIIRMKNLKRDEHTYFGPYTDIHYLREVIKSIHKIFPQTNQTLQHLKIEKSVSISEYGKIIQKIKMFLKGRSKEVRDGIKEKMSQASSELNYEQAAKYRDKLSAVESFMKKQKKVSHDFMDRDVVCVSSEGNSAVSMMIRIRNGHLVGRNRFNMSVNDDQDTPGNTEGFIQQHYSSTMDFPKEILLDVEMENKEKLENWLSGLKKTGLKILNPQRGEKRELVGMCRKNADLHLRELIAKKVKRKEVVSKTIDSLQSDLDMQVPPRRIEAFDNSNIQGKHPVAGMVCFIDGKPRKGEYRKFNIKTVDGIDDFASMREVVSRKYRRALDEGSTLPDLILIDGGKGQLSAAKSALDALGLDYIPIIGLAKKLEEVFKPGLSDPQNIPKTSPGLFLLRKIRDEVHRFAISFHRSKRDKQMISSMFDEIKGMGKVKIKRLWTEFESLEQIAKTNPEKIMSSLKVSRDIAQEIIKKSIK